MLYSYTALVLATVAIGQVAAGPFQHAHHAHMHAKKDAELLNPEAIVDKRQDIDWATVSYTYSSGQTYGSTTAAAAVAGTTLATTTSSATSATSTSSSVDTSEDDTSSTTPSLTSSDSSLLSSLSCLIGVNAVSNNGGVWIGSDGDYTNEFSNDSGEDLILVCWGSDASWVNVNTPLVTVSLSSGASATISFASGAIGACTAVYSDTSSVDGQLSETWMEYTMSEDGVVDISREVNMSGHSISTVGPECTTDMSTCVFVCDSGNTCLTGYSLDNCAAGSQSGAQYGTYGGLPSGGCGGMGSSAALKTTLG